MIDIDDDDFGVYDIMQSPSEEDLASLREEREDDK